MMSTASATTSAGFDSLFGAGRGWMGKTSVDNLYRLYIEKAPTDRFARELQGVLAANPSLLAEAVGPKGPRKKHRKHLFSAHASIIRAFALSFCVPTVNQVQEETDYLWELVGVITYKNYEYDLCSRSHHDEDEFLWRYQRAFLQGLAEMDGVWTAGGLYALAQRHHVSEFVGFAVDAASKYPQNTFRRLMSHLYLHSLAVQSGYTDQAGDADFDKMMSEVQGLSRDAWRTAFAPVAAALTKLSEELSDPERNQQAREKIFSSGLHLAVAEVLHKQLIGHSA